MFAITFDLVVSETARRHPKGVSQAYADVAAILARQGDRSNGYEAHGRAPLPLAGRGWEWGSCRLPNGVEAARPPSGPPLRSGPPSPQGGRHSAKARPAFERLPCLARFGFERVQGSVYVTPDENMATLFRAIEALKAEVWFAASVRDIRAFRIEQWSDFTPLIKGI